MAQLTGFENRGYAEIIRMLLTLADVEVYNNRGRQLRGAGGLWAPRKL